MFMIFYLLIIFYKITMTQNGHIKILFFEIDASQKHTSVFSWSSFFFIREWFTFADLLWLPQLRDGIKSNPGSTIWFCSICTLPIRAKKHLSALQKLVSSQSFSHRDWNPFYLYLSELSTWMTERKTSPSANKSMAAHRE